VPRNRNVVQGGSAHAEDVGGEVEGVVEDGEGEGWGGGLCGGAGNWRAVRRVTCVRGRVWDISDGALEKNALVERDSEVDRVAK
jgi:hypothetical protein